MLQASKGAAACPADVRPRFVSLGRGKGRAALLGRVRFCGCDRGYRWQELVSDAVIAIEKNISPLLLLGLGLLAGTMVLVSPSALMLVEYGYYYVSPQPYLQYRSHPYKSGQTTASDVREARGAT
jgi:hypothetical protein